MPGRLDGKVCFITGTAGGQGAAAAELFAAEGAVVVGCDIKLDGIDLADPDQAAGWIERGVAEAGRIDVLYNNASATRVGPFEELTWEDWQFVLRNELDLIFTVTKAAWPHLKAAGGGADHQHRLGVGVARRRVHRAGRARRGQGRRAGDHPTLGRVRRPRRDPRQLDQSRA